MSLLDHLLALASGAQKINPKGGVAHRRERYRPLRDGSNQGEFFADFGECFDGLVEVLRFVGGRNLYANTRLAFGDDREAETDDVDALGQEITRDVV